MPIYLAWQKRGQALFNHLALINWEEATLSGAGQAERVPIADASDELFSVFGVHPALGRDFLHGST
jgi:hypothetical protein